jgi:hypothetical protein
LRRKERERGEGREGRGERGEGGERATLLKNIPSMIMAKLTSPSF